MRVKVGETATASVDLYVQYRCSACGHDNSTIATIRGSAYRSNISGNRNPYVAADASRALKSTLDTLMDQKYPHRFRTAGLSCKCSRCKHREPWARMPMSLLDQCRSLFVAFSVFSGIFAFGMLRSSGLSLLTLACLGVFAINLAGVFGIPVFKEKHAQRMEKLIAALPQESMPTFSLHSLQHSHPLQTSVAKTWVCKGCGTQNPENYQQCKNCGNLRED